MQELSPHQVMKNVPYLIEACVHIAASVCLLPSVVVLQNVEVIDGHHVQTSNGQTNVPPVVIQVDYLHKRKSKLRGSVKLSVKDPHVNNERAVGTEHGQNDTSSTMVQIDHLQREQM